MSCGSWVLGRGSRVVGRGSWVMGRGQVHLLKTQDSRLKTRHSRLETRYNPAMVRGVALISFVYDTAVGIALVLLRLRPAAEFRG